MIAGARNSCWHKVPSEKGAETMETNMPIRKPGAGLAFRQGISLPAGPDHGGIKIPPEFLRIRISAIDAGSGRTEELGAILKSDQEIY
jgi:hypothetical protein